MNFGVTPMLEYKVNRREYAVPYSYEPGERGTQYWHPQRLQKDSFPLSDYKPELWKAVSGLYRGKSYAGNAKDLSRWRVSSDSSDPTWNAPFEEEDVIFQTCAEAMTV